MRQTAALTAIASSTHGPSLARARQVYAAVVRPAITYGSTVWHDISSLPKTSKKIQKKLAVAQNKCLRTVAGAFKAVSISIFEKETHMMPIPLYMN